MKAQGVRSRVFLSVVATSAALVLTALSGSALAQTDPYTGGGPNNGGGSSTTGGGTTAGPSISINLTEAERGQDVQISGCRWRANEFMRITVNPGTTQNPGTPCPGAPVAVQRTGRGLLGLEQLRLEPLAQTAVPCRYDTPSRTDAPDTAVGGAIGSARADANGCISVLQRIPQEMAGGNYELCAAATGRETVCATFRLNGASVGSRGLARTGLALLPWVLGAILAIVVGRYLVRRSRRVYA